VEILVTRGSGDKIAADSGTNVDEMVKASASNNYKETLSKY